MDTRPALTISDIVDRFLEQAPLADATVIKNHVDGTVKAIVRQEACEQEAPSAVNKRLTMIGQAARRLDRLIYDDNSVAHAARRTMAAEVGKADFERLHRLLEDLASGRSLEKVEFAPARQPGADEYARSVGDAARELSALLSENSFHAGTMRRELRSHAIEDLHGRLQDLATAATSARVPTREQRSALFAPAEVARYGAKVSSGGRPIETAKLVAVWGSHHLLKELGLPRTDDSDGPLCCLSAMSYEVATGERDPDLSHAVKLFLDDLRTMKVID